MKKYLMGFAAIIVAISLSAFNNMEKPARSVQEPFLYWYQTNPAGEITNGTYVYDQRTPIVALGGPCVLTSGDKCKRGFSAIVPSNQYSNPPAQVDDIRQT